MYAYDYPRPGLTVDAVITCPTGDIQHPKNVLLIKRGGEPYRGHWALPGGYVNHGESPEQAAGRELAEETSLTGVVLTQIGAFGDPGRDPRGWTVTVAFAGTVSEPVAVAGDDAVEVLWYPVDYIISNGALDLAFDHRDIIMAAFDKGLI